MTTVLDNLLLAFIGITETWLVHFSLSTLMKRNNRGRRAYLAMLALYFICTVFDAANNFKVYYVFMLAYILIAVTAYLFFEGSSAARLSLSFVYLALNYSATIFSTVLVLKLKGQGIDLFPENLDQNFYSQLILTLLTFGLVYLVSKYGKRPGNSFRYVLITTFFIPLLMFLLFLRQFYLNQMQMTTAMDAQGYIIIAVLLLLTAITLYSLTTLNSSLAVSLSYSARLEQMLAMQEKYYNELQKHQLELRRINHDIKNHTRTIVKLLDLKQYDEVAEYIKTLQNSITTIVSPVTNCDNQLINALLNDKLSEAKASGVELTLCVMVPPILKINNVDLCILLGNLLDNAVEACAAMEPADKKFIDVDIRLRGLFLGVDVSNSYKNPIKYEKSRYMTTKQDKACHGMGISNVQHVVEKYDGRLSISHEKNVFSVSALLTYPDD